MDSFFGGFTGELEKLAKKTYPISRFMSARYNPAAFFSGGRHLGARGMISRLKAGKVTGNDRRAARRIFMSKHNLSKAEADKMATKLIAASKAGKLKNRKDVFGHGIFRFLTSRAGETGATAGMTAATQIPAAALGAHSGGAVTAKALAAGTAAGYLPLAAGTAAAGLTARQAARAIGPRGLAGRIAANKKLNKSEKALLRLMSPTKKQKLQNMAAKLRKRMGGSKGRR